MTTVRDLFRFPLSYDLTVQDFKFSGRFETLRAASETTESCNPADHKQSRHIDAVGSVLCKVCEPLSCKKDPD
jgi:hypothetical protein